MSINPISTSTACNTVTTVTTTGLPTSTTSIQTSSPIATVAQNAITSLTMPQDTNINTDLQPKEQKKALEYNPHAFRFLRLILKDVENMASIDPSLESILPKLSFSGESINRFNESFEKLIALSDQLLSTYKNEMLQKDREKVERFLQNQPVLERIRKKEQAGDNLIANLLLNGLQLIPQCFLEKLFWIYEDEFMEHFLSQEMENKFRSINASELYKDTRDDWETYIKAKKEFELSLGIPSVEIQMETIRAHEEFLTDLRIIHLTLLFKETDDNLQKEAIVSCLRHINDYSFEVLSEISNILILLKLPRKPLYEQEQNWLALGILEKLLLHVPQHSEMLQQADISLKKPELSFWKGVPYTRYFQAKDGHCMFHTLVEALKVDFEKGEPLSELEMNIIRSRDGHKLLREECATWMKAHKNDKEFHDNLVLGLDDHFVGETCEKNFEERVEIFSNKIRDGQVWGDRTVLYILTSLFNISIHIHQDVLGPNYDEVITTTPNPTRSYHFLLTNNNHYDYLAPVVKGQ